MSGRHRKPPTRVAGRHRKPPGPSRWLAPGLVAVALLGAGGVGAHAALSNSGNDANQSMPATLPGGASPSPGAVPGVSPPVSPAATPTSAATPTAPPAKQHPSVTLRMVITGSVSWIEVRRPTGQVLVSGLIRHGHRLLYRHGPLQVVIGNAAAVTLTRGGVTRKAGHPGEVLRFTVR